MIAPVTVAPALPPNQQNFPAQKVAHQSLDVQGANTPDLNATPSLKKASRLQARSTIPNFSQNLQSGKSHQSVNELLQSSRQVAQAQPTNLAEIAPANPDAPILESIPTLPPQTIPIEPQSGTPEMPQQPADGISQNEPPLQPPSQVLPQQPPATGAPPVEPSNYLNNGPRNEAPYYNQNYVGPAVSFSRDTVIGATSRFGLGKNISVRPSLFLGNTTRIAVPVTYDFGFNDYEQFERNPLVVFHAGGGLDYSSSNGTNGSRLNPLVVAGADMYFGDGASVLLQVGNAFNSDFIGVVGVGLQF